MRKIDAELLAPVGDKQALRAAVINGANAVYLALDKFGARAKAENFTLETLKDAVAYAHTHGVKVYIAVNTLLHDAEIAEALARIRTAWEYGADAFIVQDVGLIYEIRRTMPGVVLHASTQMGIHNVEGAVFAQQLGIKRVVLSRETPISDIRAIKEKTGLEIEYFVHGALCVAFSGNCLISSMVSGLSGNRGRCLQLCRKKYQVQCENACAEGYYLSPKDICMIDRLQELREAGVDSFKIEGRLRKVEYVAEVTRIYRKALDGESVSNHDRDMLRLAFNRGDFCPGYLDGNNLIYPTMQGHKGIRVGRVSAIRNGEASLSLEKPLQQGDGVKFLRNDLEIGTALISGNPTTYAGNVRVGDSVWCTSSVALSAEVSARNKKIPIQAKIIVRAGSAVELSLTSGEHAICVYGDPVACAKNAPITDGDIATAVSKMGDTEFAVSEIVIDNDGQSFIAKSALNGLRRKAVEQLLNVISAKNDVKIAPNSNNDTHRICDISRIQYGEFSKHLYIIENVEQLNALRQFDSAANVIVSPKQYGDRTTRELLELLGNRAILELPVLASGKDTEVLRDLLQDARIGVCVQNPYGYALAEGHAVLSGFGLNILNRKAEVGTFIQSLEASQVLDANAYVYAFGYAPLMTFKHCPRKTLLGCANCKQDFDYRLRDEKGAFFIRHYRMHECYAQLLNEKPVCLTEELDRLGHSRRVYDFRNCDSSTIESVMLGRDLAHVHFNFHKKLV